MKRILAVLLAVIMVCGSVAGCAGGTDSEAGNAGEEVKRIALISDPVGTNPFLTQMVDKMEEMNNSGDYPMEYSLVECADSGAWAENVRATVEEGYDLIITAGYQGADPLNEVATMFPDKAEYVSVDTVCDNPNVKSYVFKPEQGAYLIGAIAAMVSADQGSPEGPFGGVHASPGQGSFPWRYGYMEGVKAINPDVEEDDFIFNYTKSYTDAGLAKELALQQAAQGCVFINAASAVADFGTFEAAIEKGFYTSGQDADRTSVDNLNILTTQVKYTGVVIEMAIKEFFGSGTEPGVVSLGVVENVVGATFITDDGVNPRNTDILTDEIVATAKELAEKIKSGEVVLEVPMEEDYIF